MEFHNGALALLESLLFKSGYCLKKISNCF